MRGFIPRRILLALPQFLIDGHWLNAEELFGSIDSLARQNLSGFSNRAESLFDALAHTAIDFYGKSASCDGSHCDLSRYTVADAGIYAARDELFMRYPLFQNTLRGRAFELIYGGRKSA
jgi:hypothetical protein